MCWPWWGGGLLGPPGPSGGAAERRTPVPTSSGAAEPHSPPVGTPGARGDVGSLSRSPPLLGFDFRSNLRNLKVRGQLSWDPQVQETRLVRHKVALAALGYLGGAGRRAQRAPPLSAGRPWAPPSGDSWAVGLAARRRRPGRAGTVPAGCEPPCFCHAGIPLWLLPLVRVARSCWISEDTKEGVLRSELGCPSTRSLFFFLLGPRASWAPPCACLSLSFASVAAPLPLAGARVSCRRLPAWHGGSAADAVLQRALKPVGGPCPSITKPGSDP